MKIIECIQGSEEWKAVRRGKATSSRFAKVMAKQRDPKKAGERKKYMLQLAAERLTGVTKVSYESKAMERGTELEPEARAYYAALTGTEVQEVGFCKLSEDVGGSPDGLIGEDGGLEIKCVYTTTHIKTILSNKMPTTHIPQVQGNMWITGRKWWDFASYDPDMKSQKMFIVRQYRNEEYIDNLKTETERFAKELDELVKKIQGSDLFQKGGDYEKVL